MRARCLHAIVACALPEPRALPYGQAPDHELSPVPLLTTEENECWGTGRVLISREAPSGSCNIPIHGIPVLRSRRVYSLLTVLFCAVDAGM